MARPRYEFNPVKLVFEQVKMPWQRQLLSLLGFFSVAVVSSVVVISLAYTFLDSPKEKKLKEELAEMELRYEALDERTRLMRAALKDLEQRDLNIYRVIFEADPIPSESIKAQEQINAYKYLARYEYGPLMATTSLKIDALSREMVAQSKSYDELSRHIKNKNALLEAMPAIQPMALSGRRRGELVSGFGYRMDPIYKTVKFHEGLDFTAPIQTPVYATGTGKVAELVRMDRGYGNYILIQHGYGYQTLYAHLARFEVKQGQKVKRGQIIGRLGNTGKSTGPHLHYEVIKNGRKMNPVYFIFNDLSPAQHQELIAKASSANQSLD
jgi:murein DD-endopeptidase MepM/ murein hydrolase activator NlpD